MVDTFTWKLIVDGTVGEHQFGVQSVGFGDGYEQRHKTYTALNAKKQVWSVKALDRADVIQAIKVFLDARDGTEAFYWRPPNSLVSILVVADGYSETPKGGDVWELSFKMRQVMG